MWGLQRKGEGVHSRQLPPLVLLETVSHHTLWVHLDGVVGLSSEEQAGVRQECPAISLLTDLHHHFRLGHKAQPIFLLCQISVLKGSKYT